MRTNGEVIQVEPFAWRYDSNDPEAATFRQFPLRLAWAMTIHKSQGSEYPAVVIPMHTQHFMMLQRNLLYTAITRGKSLVVMLFGDTHAEGYRFPTKPEGDPYWSAPPNPTNQWW